jgi:hypothetical protein
MGKPGGTAAATQQAADALQPCFSLWWVGSPAAGASMQASCADIGIAMAAWSIGCTAAAGAVQPCSITAANPCKGSTAINSHSSMVFNDRRIGGSVAWQP